MSSPKLESKMERLNYLIQMVQFDPKKHLKEREEKYVWVNPDIMIVRETEEGWWREEQDWKDDGEKQIEKLKSDKTVACGWFCTPRFKGGGGWCDPNG